MLTVYPYLISSTLISLFLLSGFQCTDAQNATSGPYPVITMEDGIQFKQLIDGEYQIEGETIILGALLDVRSESEFAVGHIENATLLTSLVNFEPTTDMPIPTELVGCESCNIAVYCQSGARASVAINRLLDAGFEGQLFNGQGTLDWTEAGLPLVTTPSVTAACFEATTAGEQCRAQRSGTREGNPSPSPTSLTATATPTTSPVATNPSSSGAKRTISLNFRNPFSTPALILGVITALLA